MTNALSLVIALVLGVQMTSAETTEVPESALESTTPEPLSLPTPSALENVQDTVPTSIITTSPSSQVEVSSIDHASSDPITTENKDDNIHQPASAPALMHRRSAVRTQPHKRRPSMSSTNMPAVPVPASHFSKPIEMPPQVSTGALRIDSIGISPNTAPLERVQNSNSEAINKHNASGERREPQRIGGNGVGGIGVGAVGGGGGSGGSGGGGSGGGGNALKKQITKISKIAGGARHRKKVKNGQMVFKGHPSWEIVLSIQFGLKYTTELLEGANESQPTKKDYQESLAFDFNPNDEQGSAFETKFAKWVHPAPFVYKAIRRRFNVNETEFLEAICSESRIRELPTPGKSGALFYITDDENFFIKTIQHIEEKMLMSMLPSYYEHICNNPNTLLTRYMAHFSVQTRRDRHIRMVVMASIFNDQIFIDRKFDLKGSTFKRFASPEQLKSENVTLKDQDFENPIFFRPEVVEKIMGQLGRDSAFLESHRVMDYSLLLGVSDMLTDEDAPYKEMFGEEEEEAPYFVGYQRGPKGEKFGVRVCMGIIDFLQRFRTRKKLEYGLRVIQSCSSASASVVPPQIYRARFMSFIETKFLPDADLLMSQLVTQ